MWIIFTHVIIEVVDRISEAQLKNTNQIITYCVRLVHFVFNKLYSTVVVKWKNRVLFEFRILYFILHRLRDAMWNINPFTANHLNNHLTLKALNLFVKKTSQLNDFFPFGIIIKVLVNSFLLIWIPMLWVYSHFKYFYTYSAGIDFRRRNLTSTDVRFWRLKSNPAARVNHLCEPRKSMLLGIMFEHEILQMFVFNLIKKYKFFLLTWSCESRHRDTISDV